MLGPDEFLEGMKLGGKQFVGGTIGGISGVLGKVTGVLGDTAAKLTMDDEFVAKRRQGRGGVGQGLEGAAKVCVCVCLALREQPRCVQSYGAGVFSIYIQPMSKILTMIINLSSYFTGCA